MKILIKKSGNSATLRIPSDVMKYLNLEIGEELTLNILEDALLFKKSTKARQGWFDNISTADAKEEAQAMEADFSAIQTESLDEWESGEEW